MIDFEMAKDKVMMGSERRSMVISEHERKTTAYHEAGHTLVAWMLPHHDPIHKVTIIPRGPALGLTMALPEEDQLSYSADWIHDRIAMALGGRLAEEAVFNQLTTGAADDFKKATQLARSMVTEWGMSKALGPLSYVETEETSFLGPSHHKDYSEETAKEIDDEVRRIINAQYERAKAVIAEHREQLKAIAEALLERETLGREEIEAIMSGKELPPSVIVSVPTYAEKRRESEEKKKGAIFQPRPREVPSAG
jgi:cell division protease FtsH